MNVDVKRVLCHVLQAQHTCNICYATLQGSPANLLRHIRINHLQLKPFVCPKCGRAFTVASNLHRHRLRKKSCSRPLSFMRSPSTHRHSLPSVSSTPQSHRDHDREREVNRVVVKLFKRNGSWCSDIIQNWLLALVKDVWMECILDELSVTVDLLRFYGIVAWLMLHLFSSQWCNFTYHFGYQGLISVFCVLCQPIIDYSLLAPPQKNFYLQCTKRWSAGMKLHQLTPSLVWHWKYQ